MDQEFEGVKRPWSPKEDEALRKLVKRHSARNCSLISRSISCRRSQLCNQLSSKVEHRAFTPEEDSIIMGGHAHAVRNHWNSTLKRKLSVAEDGDSIQELKKRSTKSPRMESPSGSEESDLGSNVVKSNRHFVVTDVSTELTLGRSWNKSFDVNIINSSGKKNEHEQPLAENQVGGMKMTETTLALTVEMAIQEMIRKEVRDYMAEFSVKSQNVRNSWG
ncbi:UNC-50 family protein isoform 1 [Hibiscus syriacus]|uniref:UNC-50 family protein isoform 1 n=1 Tax=Hibiscus syriacus TaxID=106335 RepID=A0A6A2Z5R7_HIBSY|nr:transcription factor MYB73-like [Hibiscus syriacus]KAE8686770.1 UNC-50 family protein isoform 1 [Hibiscus syriacus]